MFYDAEGGHNNKPCVTYWVWMIAHHLRTGVKCRAGPLYSQVKKHPNKCDKHFVSDMQSEGFLFLFIVTVNLFYLM